MFYFRQLLFLLICGLSSATYSQLSNFNLDVVAISETCTNNGLIEMNVTNASPGAEITFKLYLAPDFDNSIAETLEVSFSSLASGTYRVVATQFLNGESNSQQKEATIENKVEPLDFQLIDSSGNSCDAAATLTVVVLSGNPTLYEIISGPELRPLQTSNEFNDLASGTYIVRVFDDCNDASSKSYSLILGNNTIEIGAPTFSNANLNCEFIEITNTITSTTNAPFLYPLLINYTVFGPDGSVAQVITQNIVSGSTNDIELIQNINLFGNQIFAINIKITDNCNTDFVEDFIIDPNPTLSFQSQKGECGTLFFNLTVGNFVPPYTLSFTAPAPFSPTAFNINYPGPYTAEELTFGSEENTVPFGDYSVTLVDACNRNTSLTFSLVKKEVKPIVTASNNGCDSSFGKVRIQLPDDRKIVSISIIDAPSNYTIALPSDVSEFLNPIGFYLQTDLPIGEYTYFFTDNCGETYTPVVKVPAFIFGELVAVTLPDCSPTSGAVKLSTKNGALVTMKITAAPPTYMMNLPQDVSLNINAAGVFYMSDLPAGNYTFNATDICGFDLNKLVDIIGYTKNSTGFQLNRKCGSFDITMNDTDTSITNKSFWLQKYFPETNSWGHPTSGVVFTEGEIPSGTTAKELINSETVLNIFILGDFRVIKVFDSFSNGNPNGKCTDLYVEFTIYPELVIAGVYNLNCNNGSGPNTVIIDAIGVEPFNFTITSPTIIDNGESNLFSNLAEGIYNLQVTDDCGNIKNIKIEVGTLLPLARANKPQSMLVCRNDEGQFGVFPLINQSPQILGNQNPKIYDVTFHFSQLDADLNQNALPDGYTNVSNPQTIFVRVEHKTIKLCYATTSFELFIGVIPILEPTEPVLICNGVGKKLTADAGFDAYEWSTGETTQSVIVNKSGTYTVIVKNSYQDLTCEASKEYNVTSSSIAKIDNIEIMDWTSDTNSFMVEVSGTGDYLYSIDNLNFQTSSTFTDLLPRIYTVYVKDDNGCGMVNKEFVLFYYPKYFTPNGDGYNDTWHVQFSKYESNLSVDVFDRFGNFITRLKGGENGWDGTFNGHELPSTDYWFVVTREDGRIYRGHFSLKR